MGAHAEIVKSKQVQVKRSLSQIFSTEVPKDQNGMDLRLMPQMRHDATTRQQQMLRNEMMVHEQVLANLVEIKLTNFEDVDLAAKALDDETIRGLIMSL